MSTGATAAEQTVHLEGFSESLRGHRTYCVATNPKFAENVLRARMAALDAEVAHRGRKVLVVQGAPAPPRWTHGLGWDAVFHVRDVADLRLALTYIQHAGRPTRVAWMGQDPQPAVLAALRHMEQISLLAIGDKAPISPDWEAIFWAPDASFEDVDTAVVHHMGPHATGGMRAILKELRASEVGLVWSSIGESDKRGGLYWYDPSEGDGLKPALDTVEAADMLRRVADLLAQNGRG